MFSRRTNWPLIDNEISKKLQELKKNKQAVIDLTVSNPTECSLPYPKGLIAKALQHPAHMRYQPSPKGLLESREAISQYYKESGVHVDPEDIFLTASTSEAYSFLFRLCVDYQRTVLFPKPSYPLFHYLAELNDVKAEHYTLNYTGEDWEIDIDDIKEQMTEQTSAIVLVNPNNPTGSFVKEEEKKKIAALCLEKNVPLMVDEVFYDYHFSHVSKPKTLAHRADCLTFVMGGCSKMLGLPQMKLSWILVGGPHELKEQAKAKLEIIADTYLSVNTPVQLALPLWLHKKELFQKPIRERVNSNYTVLEKKLKSVSGARLMKAEGGWYAIIQCDDPQRGSHDEESWVMDLLERKHVYVHPGYFYDLNEGFHAVVSLLIHPKILSEGVNRILE